MDSACEVGSGAFSEGDYCCAGEVGGDVGVGGMYFLDWFLNDLCLVVWLVKRNFLRG